MKTEHKIKEINIFPYILARIAGESFETLELLNMKESSKFTEEIYFLSNAVNALKKSICDELYMQIPFINDSKIQNSLVKVKRDIHNLRDIDSLTLNIIKENCSKKLYDDILNLKILKNKKIDMFRDLENIYNNEMVSLRLNLQSIINKENFKNGLLISSQNLLKRAETYSVKEIKSFSKDEFRTEQSLIKYVSRMCAKTSPFSTFTNLVFCEVGQHQFNSNYIDSSEYDERKIKSHVRLNGALFLYLKGLFSKNIKISRWFLLRPNPTIKIQNDEYVFLTNFDNVESFQKLVINDVVRVLIQIISEKKEGILFNHLTDIILENEYIEASKDELENYILTLIDYGLFEYNLNVSGIDPDWDIKLAENLKEISKNYMLAGELSDVLSKMRLFAGQYGCSKHNDRKQILNDSFDIFINICKKLHNDAGLPEEEWHEKIIKPKPANANDEKIKEENKETLTENEEFKREFSTRFNFKPQQIYYEDTSVDCKFIIDKEKIKGIIAKFNRFMKSMNLFELNKEEILKMTHFFNSKYGKDISIDLLTFYEDYFREFKKPEADKQELEKKKQKKTTLNNENGDKTKIELDNLKEGTDEINEIKTVKEHRNNIKKWQDYFKQQIISFVDTTGSKTVLNYKHLPKNENDDLNECNSSHGLFFQFFYEISDEGIRKLKAIINSTPPGFGKFFSRFLHLFDDKFTNELIKNNISFSHNDFLVENCDFSHFNANIHPPLMPFEVWLPGSQNSLHPDKQIMVTDINIKYDVDENRLKLIHKNLGRAIYIFDLGFQSIMARSKLFQILSMFSKAENIYPASIINAVNNLIMDKLEIKNIVDHNSITIRPRIEYEEQIILQRKQWLIPRKCIPYKSNNEIDSEYFSRINEWRKDNNIPEEVFVLITYFRMFNSEGKNKEHPKKKAVSDDHKPQYINFKNPFLVTLFAKLCDKVSDVMRIDEMLPASCDLLKIGEKRFVTEYITQWE